MPFTLSLVEGSGELWIRDAEEAYALTTPTTISGVHDTGEPDGGAVPTGAVTEGVFSTPEFSFETAALGLPVFVDVAFAQVPPGSGTGVIDADGNVRFETAVGVDLHIEVGNPVALAADCVVPPIALALDSVAPYDPATGRVTVQDTAFTIPAVTTTGAGGACPGVIGAEVNTLLQGGGHALRMTFEGDLTLPPPPGCPTVASLAVAPEGQSGLGDEVSLVATVAQDPASADDPLCAEVEEGQVPGGFVDLRDGDRTLGSVLLDGSGVATFSTSNLPTGTAALSAAYRGGFPFSPSRSESVEHRVNAKPAITTTCPRPW